MGNSIEQQENTSNTEDTCAGSMEQNSYYSAKETIRL